MGTVASEWQCQEIAAYEAHIQPAALQTFGKQL